MCKTQELHSTCMLSLYTLTLWHFDTLTFIRKCPFHSHSWNVHIIPKVETSRRRMSYVFLFCCKQLSIIHWTFISGCWYSVAGGNLCPVSLFITRAGAARRWVAAAGPDKRRPAERAQAAPWCKSSKIYGNNNLKTSGWTRDAVGGGTEPRSQALRTAR